MQSLSRISGRRSARQPRRGATLVEFAITTPLVLLLFFGAIEFSRVNMLRHTAAEAAYEGARRGIVPGATADQVREVTTSVLSSASATFYTVEVIPAVIVADTPEVTVNISLPLSQNCWAAALFFANRTLTRSFTLQREQDETVAVP